MIDATFSRGRGCGSGPVDYVMGKNQEREPRPQVIRGNPETTRALIDSLNFKNKYTSGVLDWMEGEVVSPEQEQDIIDAWEKAHFAGLEKDQYNVLWVRHTDAGHHELHYVIPKVELSTGKSLNPKPPGNAKMALGDTFRRIVNLQNNWADPSDPERQRMFKAATNEEIKAGIGNRLINQTKQLIGEHVQQQEVVGLIQTREDVTQALKDLGFEISRETAKSISIKNPDGGRNIRLTGGYYEKGYEFKPEIAREAGAKPNRDPEAVKRELAELKPKLERLSEKRAEFNSGRYPVRNQNNEISNVRNATNDRRNESSNIRKMVADGNLSELNLSRYIVSRLGLDSIQPEIIPRKDSNDGTININNEEPRRKYSIQQMRRETMRQDRFGSLDLRARVQGIKTAIAIGGLLYDRVRNKANEWLKSFERTALATIKTVTRTSEQLEVASATLDQAVQQSSGIIERGIETMRQNRSDELERFKTEINLPDYLSRQGYEFDKKSSSRDSVCMRNGSEKLIITTDQRGHGIYFDVKNDSNKGTIIDFVQKHQALNLGQVRKELRPILGIQDTAQQRIYKPKPITRDHAQVVHGFRRMTEVTSHNYLASRGIDNLNDPRFTVMQDNRGNAVFPHYKNNYLTGYELKNQGFTGFSKGGEKSLFVTNNIETASKVYITESAIDALSLAKIQPDPAAAYASIGGAMSPSQREELKRILENKQVILATDNDKAGDEISQNIVNTLNRDLSRIKPITKDWNQDLTIQQQQQGMSLTM